jgi:hypothetical protein
MFMFRREERFVLLVYRTDHAVYDRLEHSHKSQQPEQLLLANYLNRPFANSCDRRTRYILFDV